MAYKQFDYNFERFTFTLQEKGLSIKKKSLSSSSETFRKFEDIGTNIVKEKSHKIIWLILGLFFFIIALWVFIQRIQGSVIGNNAEVFWLIVSLIFFAVYMITKTNYLYLTDESFSNTIVFINRKNTGKAWRALLNLYLKNVKISF